MNSIKASRSLRISDYRVDTEKVSFLSHISHGIRTPLNAIMGFSKLLNLKNTSFANQKKYIKEIIKGSNLLLQFVDNVIDLSVLENNKYELNITSFDINQLIWELVERYYEKKNEDNISDQNIMLVWNEDVKDLQMNSDSFLVKKCIKLLYNISASRFPVKNYEMGYSVINGDAIRIFIRPSDDEMELLSSETTSFLYTVDKEDSFEVFNYNVLTQSVKLLNGKCDLFTENYEYSFTIPINLDKKIKL